MKYLFITLLILLSLNSVAQIKKTDDAPKSQLEVFSERAGSMIKKEYFDVGKVNHITFQVLKLTDILTNTTVVGLRMEGQSSGTYSTTKAAFIDADEVDGLIKALNYVNTTVLNHTPPENDIEYNFHTRSGFAAGIFNYRNKWMGYLKLVRFDNDSQFDFTSEDFEKVKDIIVEAKGKL